MTKSTNSPASIFSQWFTNSFEQSQDSFSVQICKLSGIVRFKSQLLHNLDKPKSYTGGWELSNTPFGAACINNNNQVGF